MLKQNQKNWSNLAARLVLSSPPQHPAVEWPIWSGTECSCPLCASQICPSSWSFHHHNHWGTPCKNLYFILRKMPCDHTWAPNWFLCRQHWLRNCPGWTWRSQTGPDTAWTCWSWGRASAIWACPSWDGTRSPPWPSIILAAYSPLDLELRPSWKSLSGKFTTHFVGATSRGRW